MKFKIISVNHYPIYHPLPVSGGEKGIGDFYETLSTCYGIEVKLLCLSFGKFSISLQNEVSKIKKINKNFSQIEFFENFSFAIGRKFASQIIEKMAHIEKFWGTYALLFSQKIIPKPMTISFRNFLCSSYEVVIFEHCYLPYLLKSTPKHKILIYHAHNVESIYNSFEVKNSWIGKGIIRKTEEVEKIFCHATDLIFTKTEEDKIILCNKYKVEKEKIVVIPAGIKLNKQSFQKEIKMDARRKLGLPIRNFLIIFMGAYSFHNIEALKFILKLSHKLREENITFIVLGSVSNFIKKAPSNVIITGVVSEELKNLYLTASDIAINPVMFGSGINVKMLEYFNFSLPVITTPIGARGIAGRSGKEYIVSEPDNFEKAILRLKEDDYQREKIGENAKILVEQEYSWEKICQKALQIIEKELNTKQSILHSEKK